MSADNRICIMQDRFGQWAVWHGSGSCEYHEPPVGSQSFPTEKEALAFAYKWEEDLGYVEYGIQTITPEEQETSLKLEIEDLQERLLRLQVKGSQFEPQEG